MCGISGIVGKGWDVHQLESMVQKQRHRGPDDSGLYISEDRLVGLGHNRLSIIDLDSHAKQPMVSSCNNYALVFNGEIYNYQEIRKDLLKKGYEFKTTSDTEVLLNSYIEYGIDCINLFIGMFAFSLNDKLNNITYIVRDRVGVKPLYYYRDDEKFIFSSEIKSILLLRDSKKNKLNLDALSSYMSFRYPILNDTFYQGVNSLAPANYIKITESGLEIIEYWSLVDKFKEQKNDRGEEYYISTLKKILRSSVELRMIADVPIGAFLSGGVDSSIITALMSKNSQEPIKTFTIGFKDDRFNEFKYSNFS